MRAATALLAASARGSGGCNGHGGRCNGRAVDQPGRGRPAGGGEEHAEPPAVPRLFLRPRSVPAGIMTRQVLSMAAQMVPDAERIVRIETKLDGIGVAIAELKTTIRDAAAKH